MIKSRFGIVSVSGIALALWLGAVGCTLEEAKDTPGATPAPIAAVPPDAGNTGAPTAPKMGEPGEAHGAPMMSGAPMVGTGEMTPTPDLDKKIEMAEKATDKKAIAAAYAARGSAKMNDAAAAPRFKYRAALADYRKALESDSANAEALAGKKQIEDVYKSMGMPIPGEGEAPK